MKKHNVFLLFTSLTALLFCACSSELKEKENASSKPGTVTLSIANDTQRTISPAAGISYKDVSEWTVTFQDITESRSEKYNDIVKTVSFSESANPQIQLPLGTYAVIFKGDVTKQVTTGDETSEASTEPQTVPFYGESTVTVTAEKANVSVFVSPKKKGTGKFNFTVNISGLEDLGDKPPVFDTELIPYSQGTANPTLKSEVSEPTEDGKYKLTITGSDISSGFYQLSIKYTWISTSDAPENQNPEPKEIFYPYHDFLVEIVDGLTTSGSADITVSLEDSKTYYATTGETKGNGAFKKLPKNLDKLLDDIKDTTISIANIYMVDSENPALDISMINKLGRTYNIYSADNSEMPDYMITGAGEGDYPTILPNVATINLKDSSSSNGKAKIVASSSHFLTLNDNTSVIIESPETSVRIAIQNSTYNSYYAKNPCVTVKNPKENVVVSVYVSASDLDNKYLVVTNTSTDGADTITEYYIIPSATASTGVTGIPAYNLAVTRNGVDVTESTLLYAGDTVKITATPARVAFAQGTTFAWFVNGKQVEANKDDLKSCSITIGVTGDSGVNNSILCLAGYNGEYTTAGVELYAAEQTALLYTKYSLGYAELASLNDPTNLSWMLSDNIISDFCIDTKTNDAYIIYDNTYIQKATYYHANTERHYVPVSYASLPESNLIRMGNDDKLYVKFSLPNDGLVFGIVDLVPNETDTQGDANISQYLTMSEVSSTDQIMSFCVDDAGIIYITYKDSESNILLGKFSIQEGILTRENSITLATITSDTTVESAYFSGISSAMTVTDMHYEDGYIYLIVRDVFIDYSTPKDTTHSLGGVCKIKADDRLTLADNANPLIGWANTKLDIAQDENGTMIYNYKHAENEASQQFYFYGPQKIIAIKPKEIVIADDGASIENSKMYQKNRVVLFNLETNSITGVKTSPTEFYFSTSGGDDTKYNPQ